MIQGLCENSMVRFGHKKFSEKKRCPMMAQSPRSYLGKFQHQPARKRFSRRLKDHVFRDTHTQKAMWCTSLRKLLCNLKLRSIEVKMRKLLKGPRHYNLQIGDFQDNSSDRERPRKHQSTISAQIFSATAEGRGMYQQEGRNKVKVKDLKPKHIKDYLECKISQRNLNQPRKSAQAGPVVSCRHIPFVIQFKQIIEAPR
ncbi:hypothetical protein GQ457_08G027940 [Hibiscus cannabinus]